MTADLALGGGIAVARLVGRALALAPACPRLAFGDGGLLDSHLRHLDGTLVHLDVGARGLQFAFDVGEPAALGEPAGGAGRAHARRRRNPSQRHRSPSRETSR